MEKKIFTVAIIGVGARGANAYGWQFNDATDKFNIVALCDILGERLDVYGEKFGVKEENRFSDENEFFKEKRADVLLIATPDKCHVQHALKAFELGYDSMVEKPLSDNREECEALLAAQKQYGGKALVCHVLRYAPAFVKAKEFLEQGAIGKLIQIEALERVGTWHQAHSYVRGNWRNLDCSAPMILAKCCHDLDLLQYYAGSKCMSVSSVGDLSYFKKENAPANATDRCTTCPLKETCAYSAKRIYIDQWNDRSCPEDIWPFNVLVQAPITEEKLWKALEEGPYGRCVFHCDNNVVDHQLTQMSFENGVKASLSMTGYTAYGGRRIVFHGTDGEMILDEIPNTLEVLHYVNGPQKYDINQLAEAGYGHGGGDIFIVRKLYDILCGDESIETSLEASVESHLMGICAEESRLQDGKLVYVHK